MLKAAIVGATGIVGQQFIVALQDHPWIEIKALAASERSAGKPYGQAIRDAKSGALYWFCDEPPPAAVLEQPVIAVNDLGAADYDVIFTAIDSDPAREIEPVLAAAAPVISTASAFRYEDDVPILVPGVNSAHAALLERQRKQRGWRGFITPIPNCTTTGLVITLRPLLDAFGLQRVFMTSMQAMSGAGRAGGVLGLDILDNVIPYIPKEEEKVQIETGKILGQLQGAAVTPAPVRLSATCTRVNVRDGHTEAVFAELQRAASAAEAVAAMRQWSAGPGKLDLPSAPRDMIVVHDDPYRPQPRLDRAAHDGMATVVGRVRQDTALEAGIKYMLVSHNTKMGAAKGAVLVAELLVQKGLIG